jgi:hypothetical protein
VELGEEEEEYFEDPTIELEKRIPGLRRLVP